MSAKSFARCLLVGVLSCASAAVAGVNAWTLTGPDGGPVQTIAIHPSNSQLVIASTARGLYRSGNGGNTWELARQESQLFTRIVFDPSDTDRVFAVNGSLWRSDDEGQNFSIAQVPMPDNALQLEITSTGTMYLASHNGHVFRSTDHGSTWATCARPFGNSAQTRAFAVGEVPGQPDRLYIHVLDPSTPASNGTWRSADACATWTTPVAGGPGTTPNGVLARYAVMPGNANRVVSASNQGLMVTSNGGATWTNTWSWASGWVQFDPTMPGRVFAIYNPTQNNPWYILTSTDYGDTWSPGGTVNGSAGIEFTLDPSIAGRIFVSTLFGPMLSTDAGGTFARRATYMRAGSIGSLSAAHDGTVYATLHGAEGVYRRDPLTGAWQAVNNDALSVAHGGGAMYMGHVTVAPSNSSLLYSQILPNRLMRSTTAGSTWDPARAEFIPSGAYVGSTVIDPDNPLLAYAATTAQGVWKTIDGGDTWSTHSNGLGTGAAAMAIDPANSNVVYAASNSPGSTANDRIYKTTDGGVNWNATGETPPWPNSNEYVTSVTIDPTDSEVVYATLMNRVYKSVNGGDSWTELLVDGNRINGTSVMIDPEFSTTMMISGTGNGTGTILRTVDGGATWASIPHPLPGFIPLMSKAVLNPLQPNMIIAAPWSAGVAEYEIQTDLSMNFFGLGGNQYSGTTQNGRIRIANYGPHGASPSHLTFTLPAWMTATAPNGCSRIGQTYTCDIPALNVDQAHEVLLSVDIAQGGGTGQITADLVTHEPEAFPNHASFNTSAEERANLRLNLTRGTVDAINKGDTVSLTAAVYNQGLSPSSATTLALQIPAGLEVQSVSNPRGACVQGGNAVTCALGTLAVDATATVTLELRGLAGGTQTVSGQADGAGTDLGTDQDAAANIFVRPDGDVSVTLAESADPVNVGSSFSYTATVRHLSGDGGNVRLLVGVGSTTIASIGATSGMTCQRVNTISITCNASMSAGAAATVTINLDAAAAGIVTASATAGFEGNDTNAANNSDLVGTTLRLVGDVGVEITDSADPVATSAQFNYIVTVRNAGPHAGPVTVTIPVIGANVSSVAASAGACTTAPLPVTCNITSLASGAPASVTVTVFTQATGAVSATATAIFGGLDNNSTNNSATAETQARAESDVGVTITESGDPVQAGSVLTYRVTLNSAGPSEGNVRLSVPVTGATVNNASTPNGGNCSIAASTVTCDFNPFQVNPSIVDIVLNVNTASTVSAIATATFSGIDPVAANNTASVSTTVNAAPASGGGSSSGGGGGGGGGGRIDWLSAALLGVLLAWRRRVVRSRSHSC